MSKRSSFMAMMVVLVLAVGLFGCPKKPEETLPPQQAETPDQTAAQPSEVEQPPVEITEGFGQEEPEVQEQVEPTIAELNAQGVLKTVYFEFDKSDLSDAARALLRANAEWMRAHPKYGVVIEGHCDERGTIEYNLALGQRRAAAVRDYLTSLGVDASRLRTKSYGEERPAVMGHDERAWAQNRRAEFVIE
jgi:peptidoglycan-associated lipoprotein